MQQKLDAFSETEKQKIRELTRECIDKMPVYVEINHSAIGIYGADDFCEIVKLLHQGNYIEAAKRIVNEGQAPSLVSFELDRLNGIEYTFLVRRIADSYEGRLFGRVKDTMNDETVEAATLVSFDMQDNKVEISRISFREREMCKTFEEEEKRAWEEEYNNESERRYEEYKGSGDWEPDPLFTDFNLESIGFDAHHILDNWNKITIRKVE
ncbi:MAG TPA: hypothetical protein VJH90_00405 [archaeon]|nr:hypothetical protein [archaeon]